MTEELVPCPASTERAAFECWFSEDGAWPAAVRRSGDGYMLAAAQAAWVAWRAATAAERANPKAQTPAPYRIVAGHPALWVNVRALSDALEEAALGPAEKRNVMPYVYSEPQAIDDVCLLLRDGGTM